MITVSNVVRQRDERFCGGVELFNRRRQSMLQ
jgi:hypothetical protein